MRCQLMVISMAIVFVWASAVLAQTTAPAEPTINVGDRLLVIMTDGAEVKKLVAAHHVVVDELGNIDIPDFGMCAAKGTTPDVIERTVAMILKQDKKMRTPLVAVMFQPVMKGAKAIQPGDNLTVGITQTEGRFLANSHKYTVDDKGVVNLTALGPYQLGGLTPAEAEKFMARALELQMIIKKPRVTVTVNAPTTTPTTQPTP